MDNSAVRYPEVVHAYHFARYVDPDDDLVMHERHVVYRVEENTRWNLHSLPPGDFTLTSSSLRDSAFAPAPVNDAVLAEVNSQRLATAQIMMQARILSAALAEFQDALHQAKTNFQETVSLRETVNEMKRRLDALETAQTQLPATSISTNNEPADSLAP
jgi:type III secretory pathway component EscR